MEEKNNSSSLAASLAFDEQFRSCEFGTLAEQLDEASLDDRSDADDDCVKGRLKFPQNKLYGRDRELAKLRDIFNRCCRRRGGGEGGGSGSSSSQVVFIGGYSGTGKSALVAEFGRRLLLDDGNNSNDAIVFTGRCSEMKSPDPFDAISGAMAQMVTQLLRHGDQGAELRLVLDNLTKAGFGDHGSGSAGSMSAADNSSDDARTLVEMMPQLAPLLLYRGEKKRVLNNLADDAVGTCQDLAHFKFVFCNFLRAVCKGKQRPVVLFIDDLQWASTISMELFEALCTDNSLERFVFIGAYRANEVNDRHPVVKLMKQVGSARGGGENSSGVHRIELTNLSPTHVAQFVADSVGRSSDEGGAADEEVRALADVVYGKTLGNIFFVMQALEELVRRNALYYDMMTFRWEWGDVGRVDIEKYLSADVVDMVRSKISGLPSELQRALTLFAHASNRIDVETLKAILEAEDVSLSSRSLASLLDRAVSEGVLLLPSSGSGAAVNEYQFVHDKMQEAARAALVARGRERDKLLLRISRVLARRGMRDPKRNDWMLFAAVRHLNSVPRELVHDCNEAARLHCHVAKAATRKASFPLACKLARTGASYLDEETCWTHQYDLSLEMYNLLARTELVQGNFNEALLAVNRVLENATSKEDKSSAHDTRIRVIFEENDHDYDMALEQCIMTLKHDYGVDLPSEPSRRDIVTEQLLLRVALGKRSLDVLTDLPIAEDDSTMKLLQRASLLCLVAQNGRFALLIALRAVRLALKRGAITKYLPFMASVLGLPYRMKEKYEEACACAGTAIALRFRFPEDDRTQIATIRMALAITSLPLRHSFCGFLGGLIDFYWVFISHGMPYMGLIAARQSTFCYAAASLPLNSLLERKLLLFQDLASDLGRKEFISYFKCMRQFVYNLQVESPRPAELKGGVFDEEAELRALEGKSRNTVERLANTFRLQLAYIFDDQEVMREALEAADKYPVFDVVIVRQHLRLAYVGLVALTLARQDRSSTKTKRYLNWGLAALNHFKKLDKFGSPNAHPVYLCLRAVHEPSKDSFDGAIKACLGANLVNLGATMMERCSYYIAEQHGHVCCKASNEYLRDALWLYADWGAEAKVAILKKRHAFLCQAKRSGPKSTLNQPPSILRSLLSSGGAKRLGQAEATATILEQ